MNEQETVLTVEQKMAILNGLKVVKLDVYDGEDFSLYVADDEATLSALRQIGLTESQIEATASCGEVRDIAVVGYHVGADCYDPKAGGWRLWTVEEKLHFLNELVVVDADCEADTCLYVLVENNPKTCETLETLGYEADDLVNDDDMIDIAPIAWACGAEWWDNKKFLTEKPELRGGGRPA